MSSKDGKKDYSALHKKHVCSIFIYKNKGGALRIWGTEIMGCDILWQICVICFVKTYCMYSTECELGCELGLGVIVTGHCRFITGTSVLLC